MKKPRRQRKQTAAPSFGGHYLVMTGSDDNEFSLDWQTDDGNPTGLFTHVLLDTINARGPGIGYRDLMTTVTRNVARMSLAAENNQHPQLDTRFFRGDPNTKIFTAPEAPAPAPRGRRRR